MARVHTSRRLELPINMKESLTGVVLCSGPVIVAQRLLKVLFPKKPENFSRLSGPVPMGRAFAIGK